MEKEEIISNIEQGILTEDFFTQSGKKVKFCLRLCVKTVFNREENRNYGSER